MSTTPTAEKLTAGDLWPMDAGELREHATDYYAEHGSRDAYLTLIMERIADLTGLPVYEVYGDIIDDADAMLGCQHAGYRSGPQGPECVYCGTELTRLTVEVDGYTYEGHWLSTADRGLHVRGPLEYRAVNYDPRTCDPGEYDLLVRALFLMERTIVALAVRFDNADAGSLRAKRYAERANRCERLIDSIASA